MLRLIRYLDRYRLLLWSSMGSSVVNKIFDLMPPFLTAWLIDSLSSHTPGWISHWTGLGQTWSVVIFLTVLTVLVFGMESLFEWFYKRGFMRLAQHVQHNLRVDAYQQLQSREMAYFEEQRTGNLMAMLNDDVNQLERFLNSVFNEIIQLITLLLFAGWSLCSISLELGLIGMAPVPFIIVGSLYYQRRIAPYYRVVREGVGQLAARLENNISGIAVIKSFTAEPHEAERVRRVSADYRDANFKAIGWSAIYIPVIRIFISLGFAATLLIGAYWVLYEPGRFTLGGLAFFAMMIQRLLWPVTRLGVVFDEFERARASARRIFGLLDTPTQIRNPEQPAPLPQPKGHLHLSNISFHYKPGHPVLRGIRLDIEAGHTIGIAGPTGSGKTTLIKLLLRFYDVTGGAITFDGIDLRELDLAVLRRQFGLVSQDVYLFHGTIRENIAYGMPEASEAEIVRAARKAQLHGFIEQLPGGYDAIIGERGIKLSGGQRQRLSIARAILKDAPILILDEATSAVDTETERAIQENLTLLTEGKTAIIIAHRLSTLRHADKIIVLKEGRITESGTHEALIRQGETYADLWNVQVGTIQDKAKRGRFIRSKDS
jgi:ATP-binding cassette subfamily B protein